MKDTITEIMKVNAGPLVFLICAGLLCLAIPTESRSQAVSIVIGAALTRVKRVDK